MSWARSGRQPDGSATSGPKQRWQRSALIVAAYGLIVVGGICAANLMVEQLNVELRSTTAPLVDRLVLASLVVYVLLMALPFVPSVEIGLALILMLGADIVPIVYASTVLALLIAFVVGRLVPEHLLAAGFARLGLMRAAALVERLRPLDQEARVAFLVERFPGRFSPWLIRHRHWAIAVVLNIPGNNLVGGGGGIAIAAGMTRLVSLPAFALTVALGTSPLPVVILLLAG